MPKPIIAHSKCTLCNTCVTICPMDVLKKIEKKIETTENECIGCRACEVQCPEHAIKVQD